MNKTVVGVIAVVVIVLVIVLVFARGGGQGAGTSGVTGQLSEQQVKDIVSTKPKEAWSIYTDAQRQQLEAYVQQHPDTTEGPKLTPDMLEMTFKTLPKDRWKDQPLSIQKQLEEYAKTHSE